jgi:hypothetical protein
VADYVFPTLDGDDVGFTSWRGHPVVVHFVTTWSVPGQLDLDELRAARAARRDLILVEIIEDPQGRTLARPWAEAEKVDWTVGLATHDMMAGTSPFGDVSQVPMTFIVDKDGRIRQRWVGGLPKGQLAAAVASQ